MLLKIRYKKTITYEAFVEVMSGFSRELMASDASDQADERGLWKPVGEEDSETEIVAEYGRIPTIRQDKEE